MLYAPNAPLQQVAVICSSRTYSGTKPLLPGSGCTSELRANTPGAHLLLLHSRLLKDKEKQGAEQQSTPFGIITTPGPCGERRQKITQGRKVRGASYMSDTVSLTCTAKEQGPAGCIGVHV